MSSTAKIENDSPKNYPSSESDTESNLVQKECYFNRPEYINEHIVSSTNKAKRNLKHIFKHCWRIPNLVNKLENLKDVYVVTPEKYLQNWRNRSAAKNKYKGLLGEW